MNKFTDSLDNIKIASPCPANWNEMIGNERKRYCSECKLNVYNLSDMTRTEAESFLINAEGRVCIKFYRRADGSVLTKDCPVGRASFEKRLAKKAKAFFALCTGIFGGLLAYAQFQPTRSAQTQYENSVKAVETDLPPVTIDVKEFETEDIRNDFKGEYVGMFPTRAEPERQRVKAKKTFKAKRSRR